MDLAQEMCAKCLGYNRSNLNAEELMGLIKEKQNDLPQAVGFYDHAWNLSNHTSATIGYRLASNYLKMNKSVDCIKVCKDLLAKYPTYSDVERDILGKAVANLRV